MTMKTTSSARTHRRASRYRTVGLGAVLAASLAVTVAAPALAWADVGLTHPGLTSTHLRAHSDTAWTALPPIADGPRQEHSVVALGGSVFVIGGTVLDAGEPFGVSTSGRVEVYDTQRGTWSTAAPVPVAMNHLNAAAVRGKIYVLGGLSGGSAWVGLPNSYVYDPKTDAWTALPSAPADTWRGSAVMGVRGSTIYLAGGLRTLVLAPDGLQESVSTVTSYDVATGRWARLPSLPTPRDHASGALVDGTLYVIGGRDHGQANVRGTVFALDLRRRDQQWTRRAPMITPRGGLSAAAVGDTIYTFGGEGDSAAGSNGVYPQTEAYNTAHNTWRSLDRMPAPVHGTGAATVKGTIYIPGGGAALSSDPVATFESFSPARHGHP